MLPWNPSTKARSPLEPDGGLSHPPTTRRSFRGPGAHEQAAFLPLHPDEGNPSPLDPTPRPWPERRRRALTDDTLSPPQGETVPFPDPLASARLMARAADFGDDIARFIIAKARSGLFMREGVA